MKLSRGEAEAPVVPVWLDQLWGSFFPIKGGRFFTKVAPAFSVSGDGGVREAASA